MRLTVLGTGTARPVADTPASGILIEADGTAVLFDIGSGVAAKLEGVLGAAHLTGLVVGHYHADRESGVCWLRFRQVVRCAPPKSITRTLIVSMYARLYACAAAPRFA